MTFTHHLSRLVKYVVVFVVLYVGLTYLVAARLTVAGRRDTVIANLLVSGAITLAVFATRTWAKVTTPTEP